MNKKIYRYYVVYHHASGVGSFGVGSFDVSLTSKIKTPDDVYALIDIIKGETGFETIAITDWKLMK